MTFTRIAQIAQKIAYIFVFIGILTIPYTPARSDNHEATLIIPSAWFNTEKDAEAMSRWAEAFYLFMNNYYRKLTLEEVAPKFITGGLTSLDPHTSIMNEKEFAEMQIRTSGEFGGLGIQVQKNENGQRGILVISPVDDTPASRAGIKAQDIILEIDGKSTALMQLQEAVDLMRGEPSTTIVLTVWRAGVEKPLSFTLIREIIKIKSVKYELKNEGVGYIRITNFDEPAPALVKDAVQKLVKKNGGKRLSGVVLDLRNNPGGLLGAADEVNNLFLDGPSHYMSPDMSEFVPALVTISEEKRGKIDEKKKFHIGKSPDITGGAPLVVLINVGSASASEIVAKTLQVYGRALVVGPRNSFGKGTVQQIKPLRTGGALRLTTAQYLIGPEGCEQAIQNTGVTPDIFITGEEPVFIEREESKLPNAVVRSTVSDANCKYHYKLPKEHVDAGVKMLEIMGLTVVEEGKVNEE